MIRPWVFEFVPELGGPNIEPNPDDVATLFARYFDLWVRDETLGFEGIFFSEHHFGRSYSPSPNLLIAALAPRTTRLRLGVSLSPPGAGYRGNRHARSRNRRALGNRHSHWRAQELACLKITMPEARERNEEILAVIDAALADHVVCYRSKYFSFGNLRPLPSTLQNPFPPRWTTVVSADSARRAARRRIKISTGFNSTAMVKRIFDAYREEAQAVGFHAGPDYFALRRRVTVAATLDQAVLYAQGVADRLKSFVAEDERLTAHVPDALASSGGFELSQDEFITGTPQGSRADHHRAVHSGRRRRFFDSAQLECTDR